jgi:hypothetical protein
LRSGACDFLAILRFNLRVKTVTPEDLRDGQLAGARQIKLACGLTEMPREIFDLADTLEVLDLSGNALTSLPDDLPKLRHLRVLFASNNPFTELPAVLGDCESLSMVGFKANRIQHVSGRALPPQLRWLILTDNDIETLPAEIGERPNLQKLMLAGNRLRSLPETMAACSRLELLRVSANRLDALPDWLLRLPRLAWLAYAGNPLNAAREQVALADAPVPEIDWHTLALGQTLGEGASGVTHRATRLLSDGHPVEAVAERRFAGARNGRMSASRSAPESHPGARQDIGASARRARPRDEADSSGVRQSRRASEPRLLYTRRLRGRRTVRQAGCVAYRGRDRIGGAASASARDHAWRSLRAQHPA